MMRVFIGIALPEHIRGLLRDIQDNLKEASADVRWEKPEKLHITLKFLGPTDEPRLTQVAASLRDIASQSHSCTASSSGLCVFHSRKSPRIVWAGIVVKGEALGILHKSIESSMASLGYEREDRAFHPHVTLGRVKSTKNGDALLARMEKTTLDSRPFDINAVQLLRSDLKPTGSVYTILETFPLKGTD